MSDDRNKLARDQFAMRQQQQQIAKQIQHAFAAFAGDWAAGKVRVLDRFAVAIKKGDLVLWTPPHQLVYEVVDVQPILQPIANQPIGQVQITLELKAPVVFMVEQPAMGVVVVGHQHGEGHAELVTPTGATKDNQVPDMAVPDYAHADRPLGAPTGGEPPDGDPSH